MAKETTLISILNRDELGYFNLDSNLIAKYGIGADARLDGIRNYRGKRFFSHKVFMSRPKMVHRAIVDTVVEVRVAFPDRHIYR